MAQKLVMRIGGDIINIMITDNNLMFMDAGGSMTTIEGLKLNKSGVLKEHPDLEDNPEWRKVAIERLKKHIKSFSTESEVIEYVKEDLKKFGYEPLFKQRAGFRAEKIK